MLWIKGFPEMKTFHFCEVTDSILLQKGKKTHNIDLESLKVMGRVFYGKNCWKRKEKKNKREFSGYQRVP